MKIFLPFEIKDIGGTATFARKFSDAVKKNGIEVSNDFSFDFDTLFIIADCSLWYPIIAKILGKKIVQRLDGVYHPATPAGKRYPLYNLKMQIIHNFLADVIIYQSEFSKLSCETFLGKTQAEKTIIIYNGVDTENIPIKTITHTEATPIKLITFAKFRRQDQIKPIIESVKLLDPRKFTLSIYGSYTENLTASFENLPKNIKFQGKKSNEELLQLLHQYDIFLFSDQSACPNSVLEAMAAGLPVVAFNRGSIPELLGNNENGYFVKTINHNPFKNPYPFDFKNYDDFSQKICEATRKLNELSSQSYQKAKDKFNIKKMIEKYKETLIQS